MKCFECNKEIGNELEMVHVGEGDFVHANCFSKFENKKAEFFDNIQSDEWYDNWLTE